MTNDRTLTNDQRARANAALDSWYANPTGGGDYRAHGAGWEVSELVSMHAALQAPTLDEAMQAFGVAPDPVLSTPDQDAENRVAMTALRQHLGQTA